MRRLPEIIFGSGILLILIVGCGMVQKETFVGSTTPDKPPSLTANLTVSVSGNGFVEILDVSDNAVVSGSSFVWAVLKNTEITLNAVPSPSISSFKEWVGVSPTDNSPLTLNIVNDLSVQAVFE
ncbi:hypothetical protein NO2_0792 [Candidatus Termititenax persephonae]|uniref:Bacterial repeat domain-containing protein n=1 Tax=Candidatus Termititenax persephonae TaxID=2218525 RepID=A0A388THL2_9BACT|nr:hypothetical protein NO2_0792 [Candidatus Termititenax persephonae]